MAVHPFGASLWVDEDNDADYLEIGEVVSMTPPSPKTGEAQTTVLKSLNAWRTFIPGFIDAQSFSFMLRFEGLDLNNNMVFFRSLLRTVFAWRIIFPLEDGQAVAARFDFDAFISEGPAIQEMNAENDEAIDIMVTAKVTGEPVFTEATA
jgi:hypothetical protein